MATKKELIASARYYGSGYFGNIESRTVRVESTKYSFLEGGKGETVILLHGFGISKAFWRGTISKLAKKYHVIALDVPGLNVLSQPPSNRGSYPLLSDWLKTFVEYREINSFHLVAQSLSSGVAIHFSATNPQRTKTLCLISIPQWFESGNNPEIPIFNLINKLENKTPDAAINEYFDSILYRKIDISRPVRGLQSMLFRKYLFRIKSLLRDLERSFIQLPPRMRQVSCPVLVIYGDKSKFIGKDIYERLSREFKNIQITTIQECGHLPSLEKPTQFHQTLDEFLSNSDIREPVSGLA